MNVSSANSGNRGFVASRVNKQKTGNIKISINNEKKCHDYML